MNASDAIGVIIVNYNTGDYLRRCLHAVLASDVPVRVVVVDNASGDDSLQRARDAMPPGAPVAILSNAANRGYARACNQGAAVLDTGVLVFLNPDCVVEPAALGRLAVALASNATAGLAGAWVMNPDGSEQRAVRRRLPTPGRALATLLGLERLGVAGVHVRDATPPAHTREAEAVSGALLCVRRAAFEAAGGFDEGYFLHGEDLDLFARLRQAGWSLLLVPGARAVHALGVSSASAPWRVWWHRHAGMQRFYRRHLAGGQPLWARLGVTAGIWLRWLLGLPVALMGGGRHRRALGNGS